MKVLNYRSAILSYSVMLFTGLACQKTTTAPSVSAVAAFTVVNAIPNNSAVVIPVINTSQAIMWFNTAYSFQYQSWQEYSPVGGNDTVYVVQQNSDTLNIGPKATGQIFYGILPLNKGGIYSLFLCGADTSSPDFLFTSDTLPHHSPSDSTVGIRFVNLSTGSNPISINLEGSPNGSELSNLPYKSITGFKNYFSNASASITGYLFVIRDVATGDSLASIQLSGRSGVIGIKDPNNSNMLTFKNVTIALTGQPGINAAVPQSAILIDNY